VLAGFTLGGFTLAGFTLAATPAAQATAAAPSQDLLGLMAEGKTETDLGHYDAAMRALSAIVDAPEAPSALRLEALVRLGVARRFAGDDKAAFEAFDGVAHAPDLDASGKALLVQALGGGLPDPKRWEAIWPRVTFATETSEWKRPAMVVVWPDSTPARQGQGEHVTISFSDADLGDVFRLVADISRLNVVVFPGVQGKVTLEAHDEPWERILDRAVSPNGLAWQREDNVLLIAPPEQLPKARSFTGRRATVDFRDSDLKKTLAEIAHLGGATVDFDPAVSGKVTIRLNEVRWDQAFEIVARTNGLDFSEEGNVLKVTVPAR